MTAERATRIWLHPPEYWAATAGMLPHEAEQFMDKIMSLAQNREFDALRSYDFISIEEKEERKDGDDAA